MGQLRVVEVWLWGVEGEDGLVWAVIFGKSGKTLYGDASL